MTAWRAANARPPSWAGWSKSTAAVLRELAAGQRPLTHAALDELPDGKPLRHLRTILVATGTLPPRDEQLARLETWISRAVAGRPRPGRAPAAAPVRRLARRPPAPRPPGRAARHLRPVPRRPAEHQGRHRPAGLARRPRPDPRDRHGKATSTHGWATPRPAHRTDAGNFVRWARRNKLTTLDFAAVKWGGPSGVIDTETRWEQARRLLHDDSLKPEDRLAGLLVLLYAQRTTAISRLTLSHLQAADGQVLIRLGREPVVLPEPLDALALQVAATRRGHAALGDDGTSAWLFPGGQPGQPISAFQLGERLRQIGIHCGQSRSAALFQLATDLPAAILASMLGIHISVAVQWQRASAGDWTAYAADVSRRTRSH